MSTQYFLKQTIGSEDNVKKLATKPELDQSSFHYMKQIVLGDKLVEFMSSSFCEMFNSQRLLIPGIQVKMRYLPSEQDFPLLSVKENKGKYRLELINAKILAKLVTVEQSVIPRLMSKLDSGDNCLYPFVRTSVTVHSVPANVTSFDFPALFNGALPTQILAGFLGNDNFEGNNTFLLIFLY